ncbi:MAG: TIGR02302 family protein [Pseudomonadota bacterium]
MTQDLRDALSGTRTALRLTWAGMLAERLTRALWPLLAVVLAVLGALMLGLQDLVAVEAVWIAAVIAALGAGAALVYGLRIFRLPSKTEAIARLDESLPGRPLTALMDNQAIGGGDPASAAVWRAHKDRMLARAASAKAVPGDLRTSARDPYALRYAALLVFLVALAFGSIWRVGSVATMTPGGGDALASGPTWEGWAESPRYTNRPTIYLADIAAGDLRVPEGSLITLRLYGEVGALTVSETVSARTGEVPPASDPAQDFVVVQDGTITIDGPGGRTWSVVMIPDDAPSVEVLGPPAATALGETTLPFAAADDYGVEAGEAVVSLDLVRVDRRHGLTVDPEAQPTLAVPLPMPFTGGRDAFEENLVDDFSKHPWANLPVQVTLSVLDASEQQGLSEPFEMVLPGRRFFDPLAAAIVEQRRDLLWSRTNARRAAQILRAVSFDPDEVFRSQTLRLQLFREIRRMEALASYGMTDEQQAEIAENLWGLALRIEEGDLADALERMREAQERLEQAMREGASDEEIANLMDELRRATEDYLRQLSRQAELDRENQDPSERGPQGESMQMSQNDLQEMMDRIQELMEQGRMAEAQQALQELQQMMENMRVTQQQQGQGGQSAGEQAMEGLADTLREQQGLSDEAFRDLQEQFNPNAQAGESQQNQGRDGGQGRGEQHSQQGQGQQGQQGQQQQGGGGQDQAQGQDQQGGQGGNLADRQQALRDELRRQQGNLPGAGTPEGDAARDALDRAGRAMDRAEDALRQGDNPGAIDNQAQAMDALRDGMRALGEAMAQEQQNQQGQGNAEAQREAQSQDPLGRDQGSTRGGTGTERSDMVQGDDVYRRARDLLAEIRRRAGEGERPDVELDYLGRLLERF